MFRDSSADKAFIVKLKGVSSIPNAYVVERENWLLYVVTWPLHTGHGTHGPTPTRTYKNM